MVNRVGTVHEGESKSVDKKQQGFSRGSIQKTVQYLESTLEGKNFLNKELHSIGFIRHGKTANIDNEGDSQKDESVGLAPSEFDFETSTIRITAEQIVAMGYKKVNVYQPGDTLRNRQTAELLEQFINKIDPSVAVVHDSGFNDLALFHARKQITKDIYTDLLAQDYLMQGERMTIEELQGKKHVLGENRRITLSDSTAQMMQEKNPQLYQKIVNLYEESYGTIIQRAGSGVDRLRQYVASYPDKDTFHAVICYRTTLQACDQVMKSNKDVAGVDSFFDIGFAQMNVVQCNDQGNSVHALTMNSRDYNPENYEQDIADFHAINPRISLDNKPYENMQLINAFLMQTELFLEYCLGGKLPNKQIMRRKNILEWALHQPVPPVMARRIIETVLSKYDKKNDSDGSVGEWINAWIGEYCGDDVKEPEKMLKLLWSYSSIIDRDPIIIAYFFKGLDVIILPCLMKHELARIQYYYSEVNTLKKIHKRQEEYDLKVQEYNKLLQTYGEPTINLDFALIKRIEHSMGHGALTALDIELPDGTKIREDVTYHNSYEFYEKEAELILRKHGIYSKKYLLRE